jgi:hypothetical protein
MQNYKNRDGKVQVPERQNNIRGTNRYFIVLFPLKKAPDGFGLLI